MPTLLLTHLLTVALAILFSFNAFWIISKVSGLYLESFRLELLIIEHPKCPISQVGIKTFHFPWCDNGAKQTPGKGGLHIEEKKFDE